MKVKTSKLTGPALNWAVARCEGFESFEFWHTGAVTTRQENGLTITHRYSTDWAQGGPIVEREGLWVRESAVVSPAVADVMTPDQKWFAYAKQYPDSCKNHCLYGSTFLVAAMRCFVTSRLGDEVDVPEELCASAI